MRIDGAENLADVAHIQHSESSRYRASVGGYMVDLCAIKIWGEWRDTVMGLTTRDPTETGLPFDTAHTSPSTVGYPNDKEFVCDGIFVLIVVNLSYDDLFILDRILEHSRV